MNSQSDRNRILSRDYDLVIVGGGFHGAHAFVEAAMRGVDVLLVEQGDYCSGASANSLKTVHGGIRDLQSGNLRRVWRAARARQLWANRAPRLVKPLACIAPLPRSLLASPTLVRSAAIVYQMIAKSQRSSSPSSLTLQAPRVVPAREYRHLAAPFDDESTAHGLHWEDYQLVDSERMVMDMVAAGRRAGGSAINYARASVDEKTGDGISVVRVRDQTNDCCYEITAHSVISLAGSAPGDFAISQPKDRPTFSPVLAVNVVVNRSLTRLGVAFKNRSASTSAGKRYFFCVPWGVSTIIGTWYWRTPVDQKPEISAQEFMDLDEVLDQINLSLKGDTIRDQDVTRIHWGWLPGKPGKHDDAEKSLFKDPLIYKIGTMPKMTQVAAQGTKFTHSNLVALEALGALRRKEPQNPGFDEPVSREISPVVSEKQLREFARRASECRVDAQTVARLCSHYGSGCEKILDIIGDDPALARPIDRLPDTVSAEIVYGARFEQAIYLADVIFRRTGLGGHALPSARVVEHCSSVMAHECGWSSSDQRAQVRRLMNQPFDSRWIRV